MKISGFLAVLFILATFVFAYLFFQQRPDARNWEKLVANSDSASKIHQRNQDQLHKDYADHKINVTGIDSSIGFDDVRLGRAYIDTFNVDTTDLDKYLVAKGCPKMTREIWVDGNAVCDLAKLIVQYNYDGVRLYLAKYGSLALLPDPDRRNHKNDQGAYDHRYTAVMVTTQADPKDPDNHMDVFQSPANAKVIQGLYNYHDVCPPTCPSTGAVLNKP